MSRLLESLKKAQQERSETLSDDAPNFEHLQSPEPLQQGNFWTGVALLLLVSLLAFAGFVLLQFVLNGIEPIYWWERFLMALSALSNG